MLARDSGEVRCRKTSMVALKSVREVLVALTSPIVPLACLIRTGRQYPHPLYKPDSLKSGTKLSSLARIRTAAAYYLARIRIRYRDCWMGLSRERRS
jgi:predicted NAD/FAD-binding protein